MANSVERAKSSKPLIYHLKNTVVSSYHTYNLPMMSGRILIPKKLYKGGCMLF